MTDKLIYRKYGTQTAATPDQWKVLSAIALNAAEASRTFVVDVRGIRKLRLVLDLTRNAATDLQVAPYLSLDNGNTYGQMTSVTISAGTGTCSAYHDVIAVSGSVTVTWEYTVDGADKFKGIVSGTSGGASDYITVYATGVAGA